MSNDPRKVEITKVNRRGDWTTVEGVAAGKKVSVDIPNPTVDKGGEALMKRSLLGTALSDPRE